MVKESYMYLIKEGQAAVTQLQKAGKAQLIVELNAAPDDPGFTDDPPSCAVTITARDPSNPSVSLKPKGSRSNRPVRLDKGHLAK
jgi:hypothetical protein